MKSLFKHYNVVPWELDGKIEVTPTSADSWNVNIQVFRSQQLNSIIEHSVGKTCQKTFLQTFQL